MRSPHPNQFQLLLEKRFAPFFFVQFLGALNDNVFKIALLTAITFDTLSWTTIDIGQLNQLIPGLFILPFLLFSAQAGQLADKFEKSMLIKIIKLCEILIMSVAALGWFYHQLWILVGAIVAMGAHSTFFGPIKYAYLPQHLKEKELVGGNGMVEMGTFVGILLGEMLGAIIIGQKTWGMMAIITGTIGLAILGGWLSLYIPHSSAPDAQLKINWNPFSAAINNLQFSRQNKIVFLALLGNSWFWFYGAIVLAQFPQYAKVYLHGEHSVLLALLTFFALGIGTGSLLCERLSDKKVEMGLISLGAMGLSIFGVHLYFASLGYQSTQSIHALELIKQWDGLHILLTLFFLGMFGGIYIVPLFALIQTRCHPLYMSRSIAGVNILNAIFMIAAALLASLMLHFGFTIPDIFLVTAILHIIITVYILRISYDFFIRFLAWISIHAVHRIRIINNASIPRKGAALLVCNHVSYLDALIILAASPRPVRFVVSYRIFYHPALHWICRLNKAIPIAPGKKNGRIMNSAFLAIEEALKNESLVCIFPEGCLTKDGKIGRFKSGVQTILEKSLVPVIPMALRGLWGSIYSHKKKYSIIDTIKQSLLTPFELIIGEPIPPEQATLITLEHHIHNLHQTYIRQGESI